MRLRRQSGSAGRPLNFTVRGHRNVSYPSWRWRIFNVLARVFGLLACLGGLTGLVSIFIEFRAHQVRASASWLGLALVLVVLAMGIAFLLVRPYRPDLQQATVGGPQPSSVTWWTGEPKPRATMASNNRSRGP